MQNAHLRLGRLEYARSSAKISTRVSVSVDRYMGEAGGQGHLLSIFGGDADVGAIAAAISEKHSFNLTFADGRVTTFSMGPDASCYRSSIPVQGRKQPLRHLIAISQSLHANGSAGKMLLLNYDRSLAWATLVSLLGLPAEPRWRDWMFDWLEAEAKLKPLDGIGCDPVVITATRDELLETIARGLQEESLCFPEGNGPILWPSYRVQDALQLREQIQAN